MYIFLVDALIICIYKKQSVSSARGTFISETLKKFVQSNMYSKRKKENKFLKDLVQKSILNWVLIIFIKYFCFFFAERCFGIFENKCYLNFLLNLFSDY